MDILTLYRDYSIDFLTEGHKHCRDGWVNTPCPFCSGNPGLHLGYNLEGDFFTCYRCGWHPISITVATLLKIPETEARRLINQYGLLIPKFTKTSVISIRTKQHKLPSGVGPLLDNHISYLQKRGFDPDQIIREWQILGTGPFSKLDDIDYKHRIIIPFIWDNQQVSFDSRDITDKHNSKYMACPKDRELVLHKEILYGKQEHWKDTGICVEGPTDTWRFGFNSFATSGIKYTPKQVRLIAQMFKRVPVCFDGEEPQAIAQANKLVAELKFRGVDAFRVDIEGDPGSMHQEDADYLVKQLIK